MTIGLNAPTADPHYYTHDPIDVAKARLNFVRNRALELIERDMSYEQAVHLAEQEWEEGDL